jgi:hypothetical protein
MKIMHTMAATKSTAIPFSSNQNIQNSKISSPNNFNSIFQATKLGFSKSQFACFENSHIQISSVFPHFLINQAEVKK